MEVVEAVMAILKVEIFELLHFEEHPTVDGDALEDEDIVPI